MLKIVVIGYGQMFANLILGAIESGHNVVGAFRHDKVIFPPAYLAIKDIISPSPDKSFLNSYNIRKINATSVNSDKFKKEILKLNPDIILVGSWSEKLKQQIINLPKIACINCHPSLLPKYRGPNPYAQTIIHGETKTGITFHLMDTKFDTGAILLQKEVEILPTDTGESLKNRCANTAKQEIGILLNKLDNEIIIPIPQNETLASYQPQLCEKDIILDFNKSAREIDQKIRGLSPWMKCYIPHGNQFFRVSDYKIIDNKSEFNTPATITMAKKRTIQITTLDHKIIEFYNLKLFGTHLNFITEMYTRFKIKPGDKIT